MTPPLTSKGTLRLPQGPIVVTGGSGFIGTALVRRLRLSGAHVVVADLVKSEEPGVEQSLGDLREPESIAAAVAPGTAAIVHLAARTSVLQSVLDPADVYRTNLAMTAALLERAREMNVAAFVLASTNAVVGAGATGTLDERAPLAPLTPYGATKAAGEMLVSAYHASYAMNTTCLRLTNVYGQGMARKDSIVPRLMRCARSGEPFSIYGDGGQVRDYIYLDDVVEAFVMGITGELSGTVSIGAGTSQSVMDLLALARTVTGREIVAEHVPAKAGEMRAVVVNVDHARSMGFHAQTSLSSGLTAAWQDFRDRDGRGEPAPPAAPR